MSCCTSNTSICPCGAIVHPTVIFNPPGQNIIAYRVGDFTSFRHALLQSLPGETELSSTQEGVTTQIWRPTGHGDLALQMMEWWAYLADILTFYNQRIANQAYLGTADLPESVNGLVRLLGYRPRPGLGATGTLAALANTPLPFTLPQGFAIQSKPGPGQQPQVFELAADAIVGVTPTGPVSPAQMLGAVTAQIPTPTQSPLQGATLGNTSPFTLTLNGTSSAVKKGDEVLILPTDSFPTPTNQSPTNPGAFALATVTNVTLANDPTLGAITNIDVIWETDPSNIQNDSSPLQLFRGGASTQVWQYPASNNMVIRSVGTSSVTTIDLESIVRGVKPNDPVLFQSSPTTFQSFAVQSTTEAIWYANPNGYTPPKPVGATGVDPSVPPTRTPASPLIAVPIPHTSVTLTTALAFENSLSDTQTDRPNFFVWHSWTEVGVLTSTPAPTVGTAISTTDASSASVSLNLPGSGINFPPPTALNGTTPVLVVDSVGNGATGVANSSTSVILDDPVTLLIPPLQTYFNLLSVSRGKTVSNEVLGSGNATLAGQDFTLQNAPVTYLQDPASVSGDNYSSTVQVWVNGVKWTEVQSFYDQSYDSQIFVTREDDSGATHVVFGDGVYGSRLPTGPNNVVASYRYGSGAAAPAAGTLSVVLKPQPGLRSIVNPVAVGGGSDPDPPLKIQQLAPRSVLTFGRAVSADDFQVIAAQAPGVTRAAAAFGFDPMEQRPRVTVWVGDDDNAVKTATAAIAAAADPNRLPSVSMATQIKITLSFSIVVGPKYRPATVQAAVYSALLDPDTGLFGLNVVGIGQVFYDSQIYSAVLAVPGVSAVHNLVFTRFGRVFIYDRLFRASLQMLSRAGPTLFPAGPQNQCGQNRYDPGAGNYYLLPDDGASLTISVAAS